MNTTSQTPHGVEAKKENKNNIFFSKVTTNGYQILFENDELEYNIWNTVSKMMEVYTNLLVATTRLEVLLMAEHTSGMAVTKQLTMIKKRKAHASGI